MCLSTSKLRKNKKKMLSPSVISESWRFGLDTHAQKMSHGRWKPYDVHKYLARQIEEEVLKPGGRLILNMPPGHGKSELCSVHLPAWYLDWFPDRRVIMASYGSDLATSFGLRIRDMFEQNDDLFRNRIRKDVRASGRFLTEKGGGLVCTCVGAGLSGKGGDLIIVDDPVKDWEWAYSPRMLQKTNDWWDSVAQTRTEPGATIIIIQTRWVQVDLTGYVLSKPNADRWRHIRIPAICDSEADPLGRADGEALIPERYTVEDLKEKEIAVGPRVWAGLYQQASFR